MPTVLCVDGEPHILSALRRVLRREPYTLELATNAAEALACLQLRAARVILADHLLPDMPAGDFWDRVARLAPRSIRVVLTGHADLPVVVEAINRGQVAYFLAKPWDNEHLRLCLRRCLDQWQARYDGLERRVLEELDLPVAVVNPAGRLLFVNAACRRRLPLRSGDDWVEADQGHREQRLADGTRVILLDPAKEERSA